MANLTIVVDEGVLKRARVRALERGTSVNALLREYLESYAGVEPVRRAMADFLALAESSQATSGRRGRTWNRDELHER